MKNSDAHIKLGKEGEDIATKFLLSKNHKILARNWRISHLELDIVTKFEDLIIFVEVKTRSNSAFGMPETFVTHKKQKHIAKAAQAYLNKYKIKSEIRFDIISIILNEKHRKLKYIKGAFFPFVTY